MNFSQQPEPSSPVTSHVLASLNHPGIAVIYGIEEACSWGRMGLVVVVDPTQRR